MIRLWMVSIIKKQISPSTEATHPSSMVSYECSQHQIINVTLSFCAFRSPRVMRLQGWWGYLVSPKKVLSLLHLLCVCVYVCTQSLSHVWLFCNPMNCSLPAPLSMEFSRQEKLEQVVISSSRGSYQPKARTCVSCIDRQILYHCTTWEAPVLCCA